MPAVHVDDDAVSLAAILRPAEGISDVERQLERGCYRHAPGRWEILENAPLDAGVMRIMRLPEDWIGWQWRLRPVDAVAREHARAVIARARARAESATG